MSVALRAINAIELCAGSGQHGEAVRMAARCARVVCYVEREAAAAAILVARMADGALDVAPIWTDLRTFDGSAWRGAVDLVFGGFPCQPYSLAGKHLGIEDERDLWEDCLRIVRDSGCRLAFFENVGGGLREYHRRFRPDLESAGFRVQEILLKAEDIGAPHGRERIFFLAVADTECGGHDGRSRDEGRRSPERATAGGPGSELGDGDDSRRAGLAGEHGSGPPPQEPRPDQSDTAVGDAASGNGLGTSSRGGGHAALAVEDMGDADGSRRPGVPERTTRARRARTSHATRRSGPRRRRATGGGGVA